MNVYVLYNTELARQPTVGETAAYSSENALYVEVASRHSGSLPLFSWYFHYRA